MRKTNVEIAKEIASRGYDYAEALRDLDAGRTPEEEQQEITQEELDDLVEAICSSFED
jgi:hypothetical protein